MHKSRASKALSIMLFVLLIICMIPLSSYADWFDPSPGHEGIIGKPIHVEPIPVSVSSSGFTKPAVMKGATDQLAADIVFSESVPGALVGGTDITLQMYGDPARAERVQFACVPTAAVTSGDAVIGEPSLNNNVVTITVNKSSTRPSVIRISNIRYNIASDITNGGIYLLVGYNGSLGTTAWNATIPFELIGTNPVNGAFNVAVDDTITVTFNDAVQKYIEYDYIEVKAANGETATIAKSIDGNKLVLDPVDNLTRGTVYTVTIPAGAVQDMVRSIDPPFRQPYVFSFTTEGLPAAIMPGSPASNGSDYAPISNISLVSTGGNISTSTASEIPVTVKAKIVFSDIPAGVWYEGYISELVAQKVVGGYSDGKFRPNDNVTRAEFIKMVCVAKGWTLNNPTMPSFSDIPIGSWAYKYVETVKAHGVISGYKDGGFQPYGNITRAEMAKIISITLGLEPAPSFLRDVRSHWANSFIGSCMTANVISGFPDGAFKPDNPATRAEAAKIISKLLDRK